MKSRLRVCDYIISTLKSYGVEHFFILVGGNAMYLNDAVLKSGISYTAFHHEQAAVMAAEAYARVNHKIGCVVVTSGPGATNTLTGVAGAFFDSAPILVLSGQPKSSELRSKEMPSGVRQVGTFELNFADLVRPLCVYSSYVNNASDIFSLLFEAISAVNGPRPGPSLLEIPIDIQGCEIDPPTEDSDSSMARSRDLDLKVLDFLTDLKHNLSSAARPLIVVGHGVRVAEVVDQLKELVGSSNIPVVTTQLAKDFLPYNDLNFVGHFGVRGDRAGNIAVQSCDLMLVLGASLHQQNIGYEPSLFARNAKKYIVELNGSVSGKKLPFVADYLDCELLVFVGVLARKNIFKSYTDSEWLKSLIQVKQNLSVINEPHKSETVRINLYHFVDTLSNSLCGNERVVTDAGLCFYVMGQAFKLKRDQRYIVSGGLGAMGYALPAGIGLSIDFTQATIVVTGDGSMQMNIQELATIAKFKRNVKIFVINNEGYASLRNTQRSFFGEPFIGASVDSGILMPDWEKISSAYEVAYKRISNQNCSKESIDSILKMDGPVLVEVLCQVNQEVMPGVGNYRDSDGVLHSRSLNEMYPLLDGTRKDYGLIIN